MDNTLDVTAMVDDCSTPEKAGALIRGNIYEAVDRKEEIKPSTSSMMLEATEAPLRDDSGHARWLQTMISARGFDCLCMSMVTVECTTVGIGFCRPKTT